MYCNAIYIGVYSIQEVNEMTKFNRGDKVECNGNKDAIIQQVCGGDLDGMYIVRLFSGSRVVGDVCVGASEVRKIGA